MIIPWGVEYAYEKCDHCKKEKALLSFDNSNGEYSPILICIECYEILLSVLRPKKEE